jgi:site-specific recombinase XerD
MFEKFGWMVLAKRNNHKDTIKSYIRGLKHLRDEIVQKHKETSDTDRRKDLEELMSNVEYLAETAKDCLL